VTRFADDIICTLVSVIFFYETTRFVMFVFDENPVLTLPEYIRAVRLQLATSRVPATTRFVGNESALNVYVCGRVSISHAHRLID
jgi:hypothetical protein